MNMYNKVGYPVSMCYICLSVLKKCHRFVETARDTNNLLKQWYEQQHEKTEARPLNIYSISKIKLVSTENGNISLEHDIKEENLELELPLMVDTKTERKECNIDRDEENADMDKQTDNIDESANNSKDSNNYTEDDDDKRTFPAFSNNMDNNDSQMDQEIEMNEVEPGIEGNDTVTTNEIPQHLNTQIKRKQEHKTDTDIAVARIGELSCNFCFETFTKRNSLTKHIKKLHPGENPFSCHACGYKCKASSVLTLHMRMHTGEKPYSCRICDYKCAQKSHLNVHIRTHTGEKPYSCQMCGKKYADKSSLSSHERTHTGEKPYSCHICDYKCTLKSYLVVHKRTHTGEKPYSCQMCGKKYADKSTLQRHIRTHTGEKPYSCYICNYKCAQKGYLNVHVRTHTM